MRPPREPVPTAHLDTPAPRAPASRNAVATALHQRARTAAHAGPLPLEQAAVVLVMQLVNERSFREQDARAGILIAAPGARRERGRLAEETQEEEGEQSSERNDEQ